MSNGDRPFRILGWHLKLAREQLSESLAEVSSAVEIESEDLAKIEQGHTRPSEEVLMMLINHLGVEDVEAGSLWEMAGYLSKASERFETTKELDLRILYTDLVHMTVNDSGVVINFLQSGAIGNQDLSVARVGMSKIQAEQMLKILQQTLNKPKTVKAKTLLPGKGVVDDNTSRHKKTP